MVRQSRRSAIDTASVRSRALECLKAIAHAYRTSLFMATLEIDKINVKMITPVIYSYLINLSIIAAVYTSILLYHSAEITMLCVFIILMGYSSIYLVYFSAVALFHSAAVKGVEYPAMLLICVSSLGYFPVALLTAELNVFRADYIILLLTAFSSAFVAKNTVYRIEGLSHCRVVLYTILIIVSEYAVIHFYKNTIFCNLVR